MVSVQQQPEAVFSKPITSTRQPPQNTGSAQLDLIRLLCLPLLENIISQAGPLASSTSTRHIIAATTEQLEQSGGG
jgi:hypothetical protein